MYIYSIATDTLNAQLDEDSLMLEINQSTIVPALDNLTVVADVLTLYFKATLSTAEKTTLDGVISAHAGITLDPGPTEVKVVDQSVNYPFAAKILPNGKKLYVREQGIPKITIAAGATGSLIFQIPYSEVKINGAMVIWCKAHDTANFKILDTDTGTLTTIPLYPVNQFGYNVNMDDGKYYKSYPYDADLFLGLHVSIEYTNNGVNPIDISVNLDLHEVKI